MNACKSKIMEICQAGNPILRQVAHSLDVEDIKSDKIQNLICDIRHTLESRDYGVGLAAPQIGESVRLSVIGIKPTPNRPDLKRFESVIINPRYKGIGAPVKKWEGCASADEGRIFAQAQRYEEVFAEWDDESGVHHQERLSGFVAHVFQHETDHLDGILFFERSNPKSYMTADEYRKRIVEACTETVN